MTEITRFTEISLENPYQPPERTTRGNFLHKEPGVITNSLISQCLRLNLPKEDLGEYALEGKVVDPRCAHQLRIEYESISQICNLNHMTLLTKLQLCNNIIGKIEGLDTLVNLTWLDLSFNNIRFIENLDNLKKLEVLNLHRNLIENLSNMDCLLKLEIFYISSNGLKNIDQIKYLHRFICLRAVSFRGNPVSYRPDFREVLCAFVPQVTMLDYRPLHDPEKAKAAEQYKTQVERLITEDSKLQRRYSVMMAELDVVQRQKEAFVDPFCEDTFWTDMYECDPEGSAILLIGDVDDIQVMYRELFRRGTKEIHDKGLRSQILRQNEFNAWKIATDEEKNILQENCSGMTEEFVEYSIGALKDVRQGISILDDYYRRFKKHKKPKACRNLRVAVTEFSKAYVRKLHKVWFEVMNQEMNLHEKMLEIGQELGRTVSDIVTVQLEQLRAYFGMLRDLQSQLNERLVETLITYGEISYSTTNIPEDMRHIFEDKDCLAAGIQLSYEHHLLFIDSREDQMMSRLKNWLDEFQIDIPKKEIWRSRQRISEIGSFTDAYYNKLMKLHVGKFATTTIPKPRNDQDYDTKAGPKPKFGKEESLFDYVRRRHDLKVAKKEKKKTGKDALSNES